MSLEHLIAFNLVLIAAILSPGPAVLVAVQTTLARGRRAGIATGGGLACVAALWTLAALLGVDAVFTAFPWAYATAKIAGAAYLLWIAVKMWRGAGEPLAVHTQRVGGSFSSGFSKGALVNLLNPKSMLFAGAVLIVVFPPGLGPLDMAIVVVNHLTVELLFYTSLAMALGSRRIAAQYLRARSRIDRTAAVAIGALGLRLLADDSGRTSY